MTIHSCSSSRNHFPTRLGKALIFLIALQFASHHSTSLCVCNLYESCDGAVLEDSYRDRWSREAPIRTGAFKCVRSPCSIAMFDG